MGTFYRAIRLWFAVVLSCLILNLLVNICMTAVKKVRAWFVKRDRGAPYIQGVHKVWKHLYILETVRNYEKSRNTYSIVLRGYSFKGVADVATS